MSVTYYVALPFINSEEGPVPGEAMDGKPLFGAAKTSHVTKCMKDG